MPFYADLHVHSKYSRATSRDCDLEHLFLWARRKGISVVATGDFTHPAWFEEICDKLVPAEPGLFRLRPSLEKEMERQLPASCRGPTRFMLEVEISTIYKKGDRTRKVHHLIYAAEIETARRFRERLGSLGNVNSDGRPILGLDSRHLLEVALESGPDAYLVPAHIWTPWFAVLGSKSGFDSVEECYGDLAGHIFAVETGLSSDPPMNWRVSDLDRFTLVSNSDAHSPPMLGREACVFDTALDYYAIRRSLETGEGYAGTVEFFPEEGKYHLDGHRACGVCLEPAETRRRDGRCPECGKPLTVGVLHRVEVLADRPQGAKPDRVAPFRSLVPLPEVVSEIEGVGPKSKTVGRKVAELTSRFGPELDLLENHPLDALRSDELLREALDRLRQGRVRRSSGYDGEYGTIKLFEPGELASRRGVTLLFAGAWSDPEPVAESSGAASTDAGRREARPQAERPDPLPRREGVASGPGDRPRTAPATGSAILDALDPDQRAAAEIVEGALLVLAGPGTGKTRTLTHRLAHLVSAGLAAPEECLAVTFTRRAAEEMGGRLSKLLPDGAEGLAVTTFHGLGLRILRDRHADVGLHRGFRIADEEERRTVVRDLFGLSRTRAGKRLEAFGRLRRGRLGGAAEAGDPELEKTPPGDLDRYLAALRDLDLVDFDDLLVLPVELFDREPEVLAAYRARYRYLSLDEYQDVDAPQYRLVRQLAGDRGNLCAIGDPDQSIYGFRGADVGFFLRFQEDYPGARTVELRRNYRSSRTIVDAALQAIEPASLAPGRELRAISGEDSPPVVVHAAATARSEAEQVVRTLEGLLGGTSHYSLDSGRVATDETDARSFDDFAILYRTDAQAAVMVEALERSGIPYQKRSHDRLVHRPGVRELLAELRADSNQATLPSVSVPLRSRLATAAERLAAASPDDRPVLLAARDLLSPAAERAGDDLETFLADVALGAEVDTWDPRAERVSLLTLHAAKGLEFEVVFILGCADGLLPFRRGETGARAIDEERRLFFVGMTRARRALFLSYARRRRHHGRTVDGAPSPFLDAIDEAFLDRRRDPRRPVAKAPDGPPPPEQLSLL